MKTKLGILAALAACASLAWAQEERKQTKAAVELTDAQAAALGAFVVDKLDQNPSAEELEKSILEKIEAVKKEVTGAQASPSTDSPKGKGKRAKKAGKRPAKKGKGATSSETLKNGLNESDRLAFGKFIVQEINADHHGQALFDAIKKEVERLRSERSKATSTPAKTKKKKNKGNGNNS